VVSGFRYGVNEIFVLGFCVA